MEQKLHKIGKILLIIGGILLVLGILVAFTYASILTIPLILVSMVINTAGIVLLRYQKEDSDND